MSQFTDIKSVIEDELKVFELKFEEVMKTKVSLLNLITKYIIKNKGKQMRPLFVFLSARVNGSITESTHVAASLIELLHTATLVHDDVVDDANMRRGVFSINALWKNKIAVLIGDFLLSRGMLLALETKEYRLLEIVSKATKQMSEGELLQIEKALKLDISEDVYFEIIRQKTATLIGASCAAGAASAGATKEMIDKFWKLGEYIGIAFQIKDDLFDYQNNNKTGKVSGNDLKEKKITLPLIFMLNKMSTFDRRKIILQVKFASSKASVRNEIISKVLKSGGIDYSKQKMDEYLDKALAILDEFPDDKYKEALKSLINYSISRNK